MAVEVPHEVALFLNIMGVPYPDIDEDQIRELARQVRDFATRVASTHESVTGAIQQMGSVYSGYSYEQLVATWGRISADHLAGLDRACRIAARVLDTAAQVITVVKVVVLAELAALAAGYAGLMAASVATAGVSAALTAAIREAATRVVSALEQMLLGYIIAEVIGKAVEPLEDVVSRMVKGVVDEAADALGVPPPSTNQSELRIEPDEVLRYAQVLDDYADDVLDHAVRFVDNVASLDFTTPSRPGDPGPAVGRTASGPDSSTAPESTVRTPASSERADALSASPGPDASSSWSRTDVLPSPPRQPDAPAPAPAPGERAGNDASRAVNSWARSPVTSVRDDSSPTGGREHPDRSGISRTFERSAPEAPERLDSTAGSSPGGNADLRAAAPATADTGPHLVVASDQIDRNAPAAGGDHGSSRAAAPNRPQSDDNVRSTPWSRSERSGQPGRSPRRPPRRRAERRAGPVVLRTPADTPWSARPAVAAPKTKVFLTRVDRPRPPCQSDETPGRSDRSSATDPSTPKPVAAEPTP
ncbi:WXG100-like domain-containing protein [Nocardia sp. NBC_01329]|uniref:WXG100-like domain-containing protein n=1 Tax=Nocardia sp. NBC_01329 TaxID=2903594 RepID=UPI002E1547E0|nr:hypothetical protein OG405_02950 [Nocardia sp. NBC_01329]